MSEPKITRSFDFQVGKAKATVGMSGVACCALPHAPCDLLLRLTRCGYRCAEPEEFQNLVKAFQANKTELQQLDKAAKGLLHANEVCSQFSLSSVALSLRLPAM